MNTRTPMQPYLSNSLAIRQEIQRFESVHPSIYAIYDLIDAIPDHLIQQQIREHVVCIEDSFVNSQEWTLSRSVPDLKLGILGSVHSGKSALVHRYLTGSYMQEESPEGGRFKKEVIIDGQSYLLLIRDEGGSPELQFTQWVDAVIFVFSLENEMSFQTVYSYYAKMCHYRNSAEIPLILVGTQDSISESNPRVIDDTRARKCATDLKRCSYYETCATYGLNVERVFQDACQKIVQVRYPSLPSTIPCMPPVPSTPIHAHRAYYISQPMANKPFDTHSTSSQSTSSSGTLVTTGSTPSGSTQNVAQVQPNVKEVSKDSRQEKTDKKKEKQEAEQGDRVDLATSTPLSARKNKKSSVIQKSNSFSSLSLLQDKMDKYLMELEIHENTSPVTPTASRVSNKGRSSLVLEKSDSKDLPTPSSTPTQSRKNRRRSNLFNPKNKEEEKKGASVEAEKLGSGRVIPIKQGYLYKKSHGLNKEWKKKYVTLLDDGRLTYHPSLHDYMDDVHAKEINLIHTTVKIPGLRPRTTKTVPNYPAQHPNQDAKGESKTSFSLSGKSSKDKENVRLTGFDVIRERHNSNSDAPFSNSVTGPSEGVANGDGISSKLNGNSIGSKIDTPNVKKRHRRAKSGGLKNVGDGDDSDGYEFMIVSLENKQWHFEAGDSQERDEWINAIEQQILNSLQGNEINKSNKRSTPSDPAGMQAIRTIRGNNSCADCGAPNPDWASINLGTIVCIECSGIHRNLGTHLSRVRSLDLDEWPPDLVRVMMSIGNGIANSVWENSLKNRTKPGPTSPRDEKEKWIRAKYEAKEFLPPPPYLDIALNQQLIDALVREDIRNIILVLGHSRAEDINCPYSKDDGRTALHIAAALGNVVYVQLLLWYNANVKVVDHEGRNALWYARSSGSTECVELLMNNGCPEHPTLPRRRGSSAQAGKNDVFEKLPASVI
ncbi:arf-GAP with GTPase, ANK repeat and PH domain-containing protein 3-like isoform X13 [Crassostrea angulata]|uniref:arf-GAP with GTPase, ANK repeat and PH domain-containing protein 1 isoform X14 n=1 Tax=Magallana gigas TaxID=29159 RepID=UPI0005C393FB|nr:arf-GAP with GTPase, ANK repeat and PH domain-containing protein 3 isoform X16 [Crassostrea gigas]XP_052682837.1 arf-GAP with GTPase, ANK repeat and PH domain-containing protein 3-like isoform X13 [Crassostrea angulata]|eukprot:XP_011423962.1 PREDICTED: arf-GAP with GTPase, ANK repeat and PH domain-containing protein 3 isoform X12 [Crassostrea gigas]